LCVAEISRTSTTVGARAADALDLAGLDRAQELGLRLEREVADLVEEERAGVGELELALLRLHRAGERALLVAEELALDQVLRDRGAVELDERTLRAAAAEVDRARDQVLARSVLAGDQHLALRRGDALDLAHEPCAGPRTRR
jgi:hypothetical protein